VDGKGSGKRRKCCGMAQIYSEGHSAPHAGSKARGLIWAGIRRAIVCLGLANIEYIVQADGMGDIERFSTASVRE